VKILAIDTATENCSAALLLDGRIEARSQRLERGHAALILPMVDELLRAAGTSLTSLTAIGFGRGPGAFTGVRLAASVAQGLAYGAQLPVVPVSDLRAVAQLALDPPDAVPRVLVCADARMQEVYWGCFELGPAGLAVEAAPERVSPPGAVTLPAQWQGAGAAPAGAGSAFAAYPELEVRLRPQLSRVHTGLLPHAREIARLALGEVRSGNQVPAEQALPVYLRDDVARPPPGGSFN
jgi:tRNA threonylcarbamoyladenosine biosynthesis protein TsaB